VTDLNKVKLSEGEALKNVDSKGSDNDIQVWIPKSTIEYEREKLKLQIELLKWQTHVKKTGQRIVMLFEGRDAAGKGGTIKRIREHLNPRGARVVALEKPSDREKTQWYFQRYTDHLPSAGEIVIFDRSWYNRSMVEPVMGFCTDEQHKRFLKYAPVFERILTKEGIILFKLYFSVSKKMQLKRFEKRTKDPLKQYKLSPVDMQAQDLWGEYTMRKFQMLLETNTTLSPWTIIRSDNKKKARINCMKHILNRLNYEGKIKDSELEEDMKIVISGIDEIKLMEGNLSKPHKLPG
jgi:polyphosphate kinase 2